MPVGPIVKKKDNEAISSVLRRFRRECNKAGIKNELKERRFHITASEMKNVNKSRKRRRIFNDRIREMRIEKQIKTRKRRG